MYILKLCWKGNNHDFSSYRSIFNRNQNGNSTTLSFILVNKSVLDKFHETNHFQKMIYLTIKYRLLRSFQIFMLQYKCANKVPHKYIILFYLFFMLNLRYYLKIGWTIQKMAARLCFVECPPGFTGFSCVYRCLYPFYGEECLMMCACSNDTCDFVSGCKSISTTGNILKNKSFQFLLAAFICLSSLICFPHQMLCVRRSRSSNRTLKKEKVGFTKWIH